MEFSFLLRAIWFGFEVTSCVLSRSARNPTACSVGCGELSEGEVALKHLSERSDPSIRICKGRGAFQLAAAIAAYSAQISELARSFCARAEEPGLSMEECDSMGPRAKLWRVAESSSSRAD